MNKELTKGKISSSTAFFILILINLCWGGSYAATKFALDAVPPTTLAFMRFIIGGFFLCLLPCKHHHKLDRNDWKDLFLIGAFGVAIAYALLNLGLQMTSSTKTAIAASMEPVFTILLAALILKETMKTTAIKAMIISITGALLLMLGDKSLHQLIQEVFSGGEFLGDILVIFAILLCALYSILMKPLAQRIGATRATSYSFFIGAVLLLPVVYLEMSQLWPVEFTREALLAIMFLGIICNALAFGLWNMILKQTDAATMAVTLNAQPLGGVVIGWLWLDETLSTNGIIGALLILIGIWLLPKESFS
ncbi:MAG: DMT family transporter [Candidatus Rifleibacteriota bacterium]